MQRVIVSLTLVLLFSLAVVPVSAWATSEPGVSSSVPASSAGADAGSAADPGSVSEPDPAASSAAAAAPESAAGSDEQDWTVYNVTLEAPEPTIWDKDFNEYTPTEGYLFLMFVLLLTSMVFKLFKGGIW